MIPSPALLPNALYIGDNGRTFCGKHAGVSAKYTGRDISGQPVYRVTIADRLEAARDGCPMRCEECPR